jgi:beta-mannanase
VKKTFGWLLLLLVVAGGLVAIVVPRRTIRNIYLYSRFRMEVRKTEPVLAVFDWESKKFSIPKEGMQYFDFRISGTENQLPDTLELNNSQPAFVTVGMWGFSLSGYPLEFMLKGKYDQQIRELCSLFAKEQKPVYIRWNPEMEVPAHRYPWQGQSPLQYSKAFNHFSAVCKQSLPHAKMVWSTAGYPGLLEYYPGDEAVDYLAVTLQSASERSTKAYPEYQNISDEIGKKVHRMRFLQRPIFIIGQAKQILTDSVQQGIAAASAYIHANEATIYQALNSKAAPEQHAEKTNAPLEVGVYDPNHQLCMLAETSTEHLFPNWKDLQDGSFSKEFNAVIARKHHAIVTLEPWKEVNAQPDDNLLLSVIQGRYDENCRKLYQIISNVNQTVYLRWTHEMEIPVTRYPWQSQPPVNYIKAFRHFASFRKPADTNIKLVWGPAGDRGLQDWYPGDDVVDYISMAIYGLPDKNITDYKKQTSFETIFNSKLFRLRLFNKPIFITEIGIKGPESYQQDWLSAAAKTIVRNPQVRGVSYFNMRDTPKAWGDIEAPDWRISTGTFRTFVRSMETESSKNRMVSK